VRIVKLITIGLSAIAVAVGAAVLMFRRNPRMGSSFVNSVVNPALISHRLSGSGNAEIATLEHIGRRTGHRRLTPVHPEPTLGGFRIVVPLGEHSQWARNVVAAGGCRMQLHDRVYELDEPKMVQPTSLDGLPAIVRRVEEYLGFEYITLRTFSSAPGSLDAPEEVPALPVPDERRLPTTREDASSPVAAGL
jgi:deazaflavin-dependent oxidoreductase (nitroreductase family)